VAAVPVFADPLASAAAQEIAASLLKSLTSSGPPSQIADQSHARAEDVPAFTTDTDEIQPEEALSEQQHQVTYVDKHTNAPEASLLEDESKDMRHVETSELVDEASCKDEPGTASEPFCSQCGRYPPFSRNGHFLRVAGPFSAADYRVVAQHIRSRPPELWDYWLETVPSKISSIMKQAIAEAMEDAAPEDAASDASRVASTFSPSESVQRTAAAP
jgi:hypothetical protein